MAVFEIGTRSLFLTTLGIPYGYIYTEGCHPFLTIDLRQVQCATKEAVAKQMMTADEAQAIVDACRNAGFLEDVDMVFERILAYQIPSDFIPAHGFFLCTECPEDAHLPPHGCVCRTTGDQKPFDNFRFSFKTEGIMYGMNRVAGDRLHVLDAICICQQVLRSPLPKDKKE
jgi:hypothetical protein